MLSRIDGVVLAVPERAPVAAAFARLLDAPLLREDASRALAARRSVLALGRSRVELLEPDGAGPVARFLAERRPGIFAAALAAPEPEALRAHLRGLGAEVAEEERRLWLEPEAVGVPGLRAVISPEEEREAAGLATGLYEVTSLVDDAKTASDAVARSFALDPARFVPIRSEAFGYEGTLTLFREGALDRLEVITPTDPGKTLGRFHRKLGPGFYMAYAESERTGELRERLEEHAPRDWTPSRASERSETEPPENLWIHPAALGGVMLGVSRTDFAWAWSGRPERARRRDGR